MSIVALLTCVVLSFVAATFSALIYLGLYFVSFSLDAAGIAAFHNHHSSSTFDLHSALIEHFLVSVAFAVFAGPTQENLLASLCSPVAMGLTASTFATYEGLLSLVSGLPSIFRLNCVCVSIPAGAGTGVSLSMVRDNPLNYRCVSLLKYRRITVGATRLVSKHGLVCIAI